MRPAFPLSLLSAALLAGCAAPGGAPPSSPANRPPAQASSPPHLPQDDRAALDGARRYYDGPDPSKRQQAYDRAYSELYGTPTPYNSSFRPPGGSPDATSWGR